MDEIIHLGDFWDEKGVCQNKEKILHINKEVGRTFARAYKYIKAAYSIYEDTALINSWAMDTAQQNIISTEIIQNAFESYNDLSKIGKYRCLFASAITPDGLINHLCSILSTKTVYVLKGQQGTGTEKILEKVRDAALARGLNVESFYCALNPHKLEHLIIPELDLSLTTRNCYHSVDVKTSRLYDLDNCLDKSVINYYSHELKYNNEQFDLLISKAIETISRAKSMHDELETYYIPNMNFESVQTCWESTMARVLEYAKEI